MEEIGSIGDYSDFVKSLLELNDEKMVKAIVAMREICKSLLSLSKVQTSKRKTRLNSILGIYHILRILYKLFMLLII